VHYTNLGDGSEKDTKVIEKKIYNSNDVLEARERGLYSIVRVRDNQCSGVVDPRASTFHVDWHAQPELSVALSHGVQKVDGRYVLDTVCEGDVSGFEIGFRGAPPYHVDYEVYRKGLKGSSANRLSRKGLDAASGKASISTDTSEAGTYTYKFTSLSDNLYVDAESFKRNPLFVEQKVNRKPGAAFVKPGQTFKFCKTDQADGEGIPVTLTGIPPFSLEVEIKHHSSAPPEIYRTPLINSNTYEIQIPKHLLRLGTQHVRIRDVKDGGGCHSIAGFGSASVQVQLYEAPTIYPLDSRTEYCVGERISYTLSGTPPFEVWYTFDGTERKAKSPTTNFRRIAESPGVFSITTVSDKASECRAPVDIVKTIHPMPAVRISKGRNVQVDIHEGSEVEIQFEFWGTPPFEFTYTRSTNARKGAKSQVLETRHDVSHEHSKTVWASQEGTYEVVAIKDKYCSFSTQSADTKEKGQKLVTN
jgi:nucleoporin POM152